MIKLSKLEATLKAEVAADKWWDGMSKNEQHAYIKAHPGSKYAKRVGTSRKNKTSRLGANTNPGLKSVQATADALKVPYQPGKSTAEVYHGKKTHTTNFSRKTPAAVDLYPKAVNHLHGNGWEVVHSKPYPESVGGGHRTLLKHPAHPGHYAHVRHGQNYLEIEHSRSHPAKSKAPRAVDAA